jgi:hypothetical protein
MLNVLHYPALTKGAIHRQMLVKISRSKFNDNPSSGNRFVLQEQKNGQTYGWTDMTKLIVAYGNCFMWVSKNVACTVTFAVCLERPRP